MRVISTFLNAVPDEGLLEAASGVSGRNTILMVFDTIVDDKSLVAAITIGEILGNSLDDVRTSSVGQLVLNRMAAHHKINYPDGVVMIVGVKHVSNAVQRVRNVLRNAPKDAAVLFICTNDKVYDAATPALGIDYKSANVDSH